MVWTIVLPLCALAFVIYGAYRDEPRWFLLAIFMIVAAVYWFFQPS